MSIPTDVPRRVRKTQTYLPEADAHDEVLAFAELIRGFEQDAPPRAALVDPEGNARPIPAEIFRILDQVTNALAAGEGITVVPQGMSMTTQQAAEFLGISRPTLVRLLEAGDIPYDKPGRHRRVRLDDLVDYQQKFRAERRAALGELARENLGARVQTADPTASKRLSEFADE